MGLEKWRQNISTKLTLLLYRGKEKPKRELFYEGSWRGDLLFRARTGSIERLIDGTRITAQNIFFNLGKTDNRNKWKNYVIVTRGKLGV